MVLYSSARRAMLMEIIEVKQVNDALAEMVTQFWIWLRFASHTKVRSWHRTLRSVNMNLIIERNHMRIKGRRFGVPSRRLIFWRYHFVGMLSQFETCTFLFRCAILHSEASNTYREDSRWTANFFHRIYEDCDWRRTWPRSNWQISWESVYRASQGGSAEIRCQMWCFCRKSQGFII